MLERLIKLLVWMALYQLTQIALLLPFPIYLWSSQTIPLAIYCINPYALKPLPELSPRPNMPYLQTGLPSTHVCISWFTALCSRVSCHPLLTRVYVLICFCHVRLSVTLWTVAPQAPLSMGFSTQEYWSELKSTWVGCHALLQGIFLTKRSNPCLLYLLHWQVDSLPLAHINLNYMFQWLSSSRAVNSLRSPSYSTLVLAYTRI